MNTDRNTTTCIRGAAWMVRARSATPIDQQAVAAEKPIASR